MNYSSQHLEQCLLQNDWHKSVIKTSILQLKNSC